MCGIVTIFSYAGEAPVSSDELIRIREAMRARGPDGSGLWLSEDHRVGMAHRRLSIIDLSEAGSQPMAIENGRYRIVYNGEIYNYQELRKTLIGKGCRFQSASDTEVLLHLYKIYGPDMVDFLRGMFAFAILDDDKKGLFLARDHFGIKPLYYHDDGKTFRCASQVKALLAGSGIEKEIEPAGHVGFFLWGSVPEPFTLYKNLLSLPAGHTMWVDRNGPQVPKCYFDVAEEIAAASEKPKPQISIREALKDALRDSVRYHLVSDVPVGVFLSSGVDSSTITALASEHETSINAITLGFEEYVNTENDEVPLAEKIARYYGGKHRVFRFTRSDFEQNLSRILQDMDQPSIDGVNTWFVSLAAVRAGLKVVLSGLGGDELLGGYPGFRQIPKLVSYAKIPSSVSGLGKGFRLISSPVLKHLTSPKYAGLLEYGGSYGGAYLLRRGLFMPWELPEILDQEMVQKGWETLQPVIQMDQKIGNLPTPHAKISALELSYYMRNTLLRDSDWAGMAHSLEIRVPLVDINLFRALTPYMIKGDNLPTKKDMAQVPLKPLPDEIVTRNKTGFSIPVQEWTASAGEASQRGSRGWALRVYERFKK